MTKAKLVKNTSTFPAKILSLGSLFLLPFLFSACNLYTCYLETGAQVYPPTQATDIELYLTTPDKAYLVIGTVTANGADDKSAINYLKKRVTEIGADAVILLKFDKMASYSPRVDISGVAVKFVGNQ